MKTTMTITKLRTLDARRGSVVARRHVLDSRGIARNRMMMKKMRPRPQCLDVQRDSVTASLRVTTSNSSPQRLEAQRVVVAISLSALAARTSVKIP